jgi:hypothetical protein
MNDYSEIAHAENCLRYVMFGDNKIRRRTISVLEQVERGLYEKAATYLQQTAPMRRLFTYLISISEHGSEEIHPGSVDEEDVFGRLSMWRAYGRRGGVALILNAAPMLNPTDAVRVYTSPILYGGPQVFAYWWEKMLSATEENLSAILAMPSGIYQQNLEMFIHFCGLTCKHPGFREEREWRITYSPDPANESIDDAPFNANSRVKREFRCIDGVPQRIYKIPLIDYPNDEYTGTSIDALLDRIIIGPTQFPGMIRDTMYIALTRAGVVDAHKRLIMSDIPIRT